jgi:hypothetical protein
LFSSSSIFCSCQFSKLDLFKHGGLKNPLHEFQLQLSQKYLEMFCTYMGVVNCLIPNGPKISPNFFGTCIDLGKLSKTSFLGTPIQAVAVQNKQL